MFSVPGRAGVPSRGPRDAEDGRQDVTESPRGRYQVGDTRRVKAGNFDSDQDRTINAGILFQQYGAESGVCCRVNE